MSRAGLLQGHARDDKEGRDDSVARSLLDDADDESELSEPPPDEDEEGEGDSGMVGGTDGAMDGGTESTPQSKPRPLFPGLVRKGAKRDDSVVEGTEDEEMGTEAEGAGEGTPSKKAEDGDDGEDTKMGEMPAEASTEAKDEKIKDPAPASSAFASAN
jgi:hypothetical protein